MGKTTEELNIKVTGDSTRGKAALKQTKESLGKVGAKAKETGGALKVFKANWLAITAAVGGTVIAIKKFITVAAEQEKQQFLLAAAMKQAGVFTEQAFQRNLEFASSLQKVTEFGDEAILGVQRMLTNFGAEGEMLEKLTEATTDLAAAKGMDLAAAGDLVAKSIGSSTNALTRYGIQVEGAAGSTGRMQQAVDNISAIFGGTARASALTFAGQMKQLSNIFGDIQEVIGQVIIDAIKPLTNAMLEFLKSEEGINNITNAIKSIGLVFNTTFEITKAAVFGIMELIDAIQEPLRILGEAAGQMAQGEWTEAWETMKNIGSNTWAELKEAGNVFQEGFENVMDNVGIAFDIWTLKHAAALERQTANTKSALSEQVKLYLKNAKDVKTMFNDIEVFIEKTGAALASALSESFNLMDLSAKAVFKSIINGFASLVSSELALSAAGEIKKAIAMTITLNPKAALHFAAGAAYSAGAATVKALGASLANTISAAGGADFITQGPQLLLVGDNPSGRERVNVTPSEQGDVGGINISIGNLTVMSNDVDDMTDQIFQNAELAGARPFRRGGFS